MHSVVLGLDGGGTKTVCVAVAKRAPASGAVPEVLGRGVAGSSNWNSVRFERARQHGEEAIRDALAAAGAQRADIAAICLGMSGVDRPADRARVQEWMAEFLPGVPVMIHNDAVIALASGTGGRLYGIVLISGTGMIALGYNHAGVRSRAGGWGALLGDGGSGYAIGAAILRAATWAVDGRGPQTWLLQATLDKLGLAHPDELVRWAYDDIAWARFAQLAPLATAGAEVGDAAAVSILEQAADDLAVAVQAVARQLALEQEPFPLVLAGSNLQSGRLVQLVTTRLQTALPDAEIIMPTMEPALGAACLVL